MAVLASAAAAAILGFLAYLIIAGYSGGSSRTNLAPLAFPVAIYFFVVAGLPAVLICAVLWICYRASTPTARTVTGAARRPGSA